MMAVLTTRFLQCRSERSGERAVHRRPAPGRPGDCDEQPGIESWNAALPGQHGVRARTMGRRRTGRPGGQERWRRSWNALLRLQALVRPVRARAQSEPLAGQQHAPLFRIRGRIYGRIRGRLPPGSSGSGETRDARLFDLFDVDGVAGQYGCQPTGKAEYKPSIRRYLANISNQLTRSPASGISR